SEKVTHSGASRARRPSNEARRAPANRPPTQSASASVRLRGNFCASATIARRRAEGVWAERVSRYAPVPASSSLLEVEALRTRQLVVAERAQTMAAPGEPCAAPGQPRIDVVAAIHEHGSETKCA